MRQRSGLSWILRSRASIVVFVSVAMVAPVTARADHVPLRSGTVISSTAIVWQGRQGCNQSPDCAVWLAMNCDPRLAGIDPALTASIVDVANLAGSKRWLEIGFPYSGWLDSTYEFWNRSCVRVGSFHGSSQQFTVPTGAKWMTIPATGVGAFTWAIY